MKKSLLGFAVLLMALSCKKIPEGGNKNILKLEEGVERYDTNEERGSHSEASHEMSGESMEVQ